MAQSVSAHLADASARPAATCNSHYPDLTDRVVAIEHDMQALRGKMARSEMHLLEVLAELREAVEKSTSVDR